MATRKRYWCAAGIVNWNTASIRKRQAWQADVDGVGRLVAIRSEILDEEHLTDCREFTGWIINGRVRERIGEFESGRQAMDELQRVALVRLGAVVERRAA